MLTLDLPRTVLVWHATAAGAVTAIRTEGLRRMGKGVYVATHPGLALGYGRSFIPDGVLLTLAIPRPFLHWGDNFRLDRNEGVLWDDLPAACVVEVRSFDFCAEIPSCWPVPQGLGFHPVRHPGFAPCLEDVAATAHLLACLDAAAQDPATAVMAALYAQGLDEARHGIVAPRFSATLTSVLRQADALPLDPVVCALDLMHACDPAWMPSGDLVAHWPLEVVAIGAAVAGPARNRLLALLGQRRCEQVAQVLAIGDGQGAGPLDLQQAEALVALIRHVRPGHRRCRLCLDALDALPDIWADQALLALLTDLRRLPVKSREHLHHLLAPRASRLTSTLQNLATHAPWITARMARRLLTRDATDTHP